MAIAVINEVPGVGPDQYDEVQARMELDANPPKGCLVHTAGFVDGKLKVFDVWESREAWERFAEERLGPAIQEVGGEAPPDARVDVYDLHDYAYDYARA